ncbi:MAG: carbon-nitrogen hydrolase family protein [Balneolaceae bacterium]|nr:carbon-nitrogen hydrolase family protein [Balneolaceae bacterium]
MKPFSAAAIQMNSQPDLDHNLDEAYTSIRKAAGEGALFVGLPENFSFLGSLERRLDQAGSIGDRVPGFLADTAREFEIYLLGGSYPIPDGEGKVYNRSQLHGPSGDLLATYDKIHLFDVDLPEGESYRESDFVHAGEIDPVTYRDGAIGTVGLTICYDLRFPELYRKLSEAGADLLCVPSAFTATTGKDHWQPLLRARAIENTAYIFAPAQTGVHGKKRQTHGHSMIIDPWGDILAEGGTDSGIQYANIDPGRLRDVRSRIPSLEHRTIY